MKNGFYWVKLNNEWEIAEYVEIGANNWWSFTGVDDTYSSSDLEEIGDYIETPDKYKQDTI